MTRKIAFAAALLQGFMGLALLVGTIWWLTSAKQSLRTESIGMATNLTSVADALEAVSHTYADSSENLFSLTNTLTDVGDKLGHVSSAISIVGTKFDNQGQKQLEFAGKLDDTWIGDKLSLGSPFRALGGWCANTGTNINEIGEDVRSVSLAMSQQGETIAAFRADGFDKSLLAMRTTVDTLNHAADLLNNGENTNKWSNFIGVLGASVSLLFFVNGLLLFLCGRAAVQSALDEPELTE